MSAMREAPYYRPDLARIHHLGFGFHADDCAPGILALLEPVRERDGLVVELGCGTGLLTRYLLDAGHRVIATDASPAMLDIAREYAGDAMEIRRLVLPDDPIPEADAIVAIGHPISYLPDEAAVDRALVAAAEALRPDGILALNLCDLTWASERTDWRPRGWIGDDWALVTESSSPRPDRFAWQMAIFTANRDGTWRRDDEHHELTLIDTTRVPALLAEHEVESELGGAFGDEPPLVGLHTVVGRRRP
jgi:SAM-dependent methyltransferase